MGSFPTDILVHVGEPGHREIEAYASETEVAEATGKDRPTLWLCVPRPIESSTFEWRCLEYAQR